VNTPRAISTPEQMNPLSHEYLSFNIGFPNVFDRSLGRAGSFIMVHGGCSSIGCYAMTISKWTKFTGVVAEAFRGDQDKVQLQTFAFRVTEANLALHANSPDVQFWSMLKEGSVSFEKVGHTPIVSVCNQISLPLTRISAPMFSCPATTVASKPIADAMHPAEKVSTVASTVWRKQFAERFRTKTQTIMRPEVGALRSSAKSVALHNVKERRLDKHV
jgi:murein L,D-transpeptidase YafK